jgi:hypothetical protein
MIDKKSILCPSARCEEDAILLGVVENDGHVAFVNRKIVVDKEFVNIAHEGRPPEKRFRFGNKCVENRCKQWTGNRCGVIDQIVDLFGSNFSPDGLPACSIRPECRWFKQRGAEACSVCPYVITDLNIENKD